MIKTFHLSSSTNPSCYHVANLIINSFPLGSNVLVLKSMLKFHFGSWYLLVLLALFVMLGVMYSKNLISKVEGQNLAESEVLPLMETLTSTSLFASGSLIRGDYPSKPTNGLLDKLIDRLIECESGGKIDAINHDDGAIGLHSRGVLQFQIPTFLHYNDKYKVLPDLEDGEVMNVIYDETAQRELAKRIISDGGWRNWYLCSKRIGIDKLL